MVVSLSCQPCDRLVTFCGLFHSMTAGIGFIVTVKSPQSWMSSGFCHSKVKFLLQCCLVNNSTDSACRKSDLCYRLPADFSDRMNTAPLKRRKTESMSWKCVYLPHKADLCDCDKNRNGSPQSHKETGGNTHTGVLCGGIFFSSCFLVDVQQQICDSNLSLTYPGTDGSIIYFLYLSFIWLRLYTSNFKPEMFFD